MRKNFTKFVACFMLTCFGYSFIFSQAVMGITILIKDNKDIRQFEQKNEQLLIPYRYGRVGSWKYAGDDRLIVYIQDLHCNPEVQKNISKILELLDTKYGLNKIYLEGAPAGKIDTKLFSSIPDASIQEKTIESLLNNGLLDGAEYYALKFKKDKLNGLEQWGIYRENLERFRKLSKEKESNQLISESVIARVNGLKNQFIDRKLNKLDTILTGEKKEGWYERIEKLGIKVDEQVGGYPNLSKYVAIIKLNKEIKYRKLQDELNRYVRELKQTVPMKVYLSLTATKVDTNNSEEYYQRLSEIAAAYTPGFSKHYPALSTFLEYRKLNYEINPIYLVEEENLFKDRVMTKYATRIIDKDIILMTRMAKTFKDYVNLKLTPNQMEYFNENKREFGTLLQKYFGYDEINSINPSVMPVIGKTLSLLSDGEYEKFYAENFQRNDAFIKTVLQDNPSVQANKGSVATNNSEDSYEGALDRIARFKCIDVIVAGGFHQDIAKLLGEKGVSYLTITPNASQKPDESVYEQVMNGKIDYQKMLSSAIAQIVASLVGTEREFPRLAEIVGEMIKAGGKQDPNIVLQEINAWLLEQGADKQLTVEFSHNTWNVSVRGTDGTAHFVFGLKIAGNSVEVITIQDGKSVSTSVNPTIAKEIRDQIDFLRTYIVERFHSLFEIVLSRDSTVIADNDKERAVRALLDRGYVRTLLGTEQGTQIASDYNLDWKKDYGIVETDDRVFHIAVHDGTVVWHELKPLSLDALLASAIARPPRRIVLDYDHTITDGIEPSEEIAEAINSLARDFGIEMDVVTGTSDEQKRESIFTDLPEITYLSVGNAGMLYDVRSGREPIDVKNFTQQQIDEINVLFADAVRLFNLPLEGNTLPILSKKKEILSVYVVERKEKIYLVTGTIDDAAFYKVGAYVKEQLKDKGWYVFFDPINRMISVAQKDKSYVLNQILSQGHDRDTMDTADALYVGDAFGGKSSNDTPVLKVERLRIGHTSGPQETLEFLQQLRTALATSQKAEEVRVAQERYTEIETRLKLLGISSEIASHIKVELRNGQVNENNYWFYFRLSHLLQMPVLQSAAFTLEKSILSTEQRRLLNSITPVYAWDVDGTLRFDSNKVLEQENADQFAELVLSGSKITIVSARSLREFADGEISIYHQLRERLIERVRSEGWQNPETIADRLLGDLFDMFLADGKLRLYPADRAFSEADLTVDKNFIKQFDKDETRAIIAAFEDARYIDATAKLLGEAAQYGKPGEPKVVMDPLGSKAARTYIVVRPFGDINTPESLRDKLVAVLQRILLEKGYDKSPKDGKRGILFRATSGPARGIFSFIVERDGSLVWKDRFLPALINEGYQRITFIGNELYAGNDRSILDAMVTMRREQSEKRQLTVIAVDKDLSKAQARQLSRDAVVVGKGTEGTREYLEKIITTTRALFASRNRSTGVRPDQAKNYKGSAALPASIDNIVKPGLVQGMSYSEIAGAVAKAEQWVSYAPWFFLRHDKGNRLAAGKITVTKMMPFLVPAVTAVVSILLLHSVGIGLLAVGITSLIAIPISFFGGRWIHQRLDTRNIPGSIRNNLMSVLEDKSFRNVHHLILESDGILLDTDSLGIQNRDQLLEESPVDFLVPGILEFIKAAKARNIRISIVTSSDESRLTILKKLALTDYFNDIYIERNAENKLARIRSLYTASSHKNGDVAYIDYSADIIRTLKDELGAKAVLIGIPDSNAGAADMMGQANFIIAPMEFNQQEGPEKVLTEEAQRYGIRNAGRVPFFLSEDFLRTFHISRSIEESLSRGENHFIAIGGPQGTGKTTFAAALSQKIKYTQIYVSADRFVFSRNISQGRDRRDASRPFPYRHQDQVMLGEAIDNLKNKKEAIMPFWNMATGQRFYIDEGKLASYRSKKTVLELPGYALVEADRGDEIFKELPLITPASKLYVDRNTGEVLEGIPPQRGVLFILDDCYIAGAPRNSWNLFDYFIFVWSSREGRLSANYRAWKAGERHAGDPWEVFRDRIVNDIFRNRDAAAITGLRSASAVVLSGIETDVVPSEEVVNNALSRKSMTTTVDGDKNAELRGLMHTALWGKESEQTQARASINEMAKEMGIVPSSLFDIYQRIASGEITNVTVPAINVRTDTLTLMRRIFRQMNEHKIGAVALELGLSEKVYTAQSLDIYRMYAYTAAMMEGYTGPIYLLADHYKMDPSLYVKSAPEARVTIQKAILEALASGLFSVDLDQSFLVALPKGEIPEAVEDAEGEIALAVPVQQQREQERQLRGMAERAFGAWTAALGQQTIDRIKTNVKNVLVEYANNGFYDTILKGIEEKLETAEDEKRADLERLQAKIKNFVGQIKTETKLDQLVKEILIQQVINAQESAINTIVIRGSEPDAMTVALGGEIGEVGGKNSEPGEFAAYIELYNAMLETMSGKIRENAEVDIYDIVGDRGFWSDAVLDRMKSGSDEKVAGLSKVAIQTGTAHGVGGDIDFITMRTLAGLAKRYGLVVVQHGASKVPVEQYGQIRDNGAGEVHLGTYYMEIVINYLAMQPKGSPAYAIYDRLVRAALKARFGESVSALNDPARQSWVKKLKTADFKPGLAAEQRNIFELSEDHHTAIGDAFEAVIAATLRNLGAHNTQRYTVPGENTQERTIRNLKYVAAHMRTQIYQMLADHHEGHLGGPLSSVDMMVALYFGGILRYDPRNPENPNRDWVSIRGFMTTLIYPLLALVGFYDKSLLHQYRVFGGLSGHTEKEKTPGVDLSPAGQLGESFTEMVGAAHAAKIMGTHERYFDFLGDGEAQEGIVHQALALAAKWKLDNLIVIMDENGKQLLNPISETDAPRNAQWWITMGYNVVEVANGNDIKQDLAALQRASTFHNGKPTVVLSHTIKGSGIPGNPEKQDKTFHHFRGTPPPEWKEAWEQVKRELGLTDEDMQKFIDKAVEQARPVEPSSNPAVFTEIPPLTPPATLDEKAKGPKIMLSGLKIYFEMLQNLKKTLPININTLAADMDYGVPASLLRELGSYDNGGIREAGVATAAAGMAKRDPSSRVVTLITEQFMFNAANSLFNATLGRAPVIFIGSNAGISGATDGPTHQPASQIAMLSHMYGLKVLEPSDIYELFQALNFAMNYREGPVYIRLSKAPAENSLGPTIAQATELLKGFGAEGQDGAAAGNKDEFELVAQEIANTQPRPGIVPGRGYNVVFDGKDASHKTNAVVVASGFLTASAIVAARKLVGEGVGIRVINVTDINSLDKGFAQLLGKNARVLTAFNGLPTVMSEKVALAAAQNNKKISIMEEIGFSEGDTGSVEELAVKYRMNPSSLVIALRAMVRKNKAGGANISRTVEDALRTSTGSRAVAVGAARVGEVAGVLTPNEQWARSYPAISGKALLRMVPSVTHQVLEEASTLMHQQGMKVMVSVLDREYKKTGRYVASITAIYEGRPIVLDVREHVMTSGPGKDVVVLTLTPQETIAGTWDEWDAFEAEAFYELGREMTQGGKIGLKVKPWIIELGGLKAIDENAVERMNRLPAVVLGAKTAQSYEVLAERYQTKMTPDSQREAISESAMMNGKATVMQVEQSKVIDIAGLAKAVRSRGGLLQLKKPSLRINYNGTIVLNPGLKQTLKEVAGLNVSIEVPAGIPAALFVNSLFNNILDVNRTGIGLSFNGKHVNLAVLEAIAKKIADEGRISPWRLILVDVQDDREAALVRQISEAYGVTGMRPKYIARGEKRTYPEGSAVEVGIKLGEGNATTETLAQVMRSPAVNVVVVDLNTDKETLPAMGEQGIGLDLWKILDEFAKFVTVNQPMTKEWSQNQGERISEMTLENMGRVQALTEDDLSSMAMALIRALRNEDAEDYNALYTQLITATGQMRLDEGQRAILIAEAADIVKTIKRSENPDIRSAMMIGFVKGLVGQTLSHRLLAGIKVSQSETENLSADDMTWLSQFLAKFSLSEGTEEPLRIQLMRARIGTQPVDANLMQKLTRELEDGDHITKASQGDIHAQIQLYEVFMIASDIKDLNLTRQKELRANAKTLQSNAANILRNSRGNLSPAELLLLEFLSNQARQAKQVSQLMKNRIAALLLQKDTNPEMMAVAMELYLEILKADLGKGTLMDDMGQALDNAPKLTEALLSAA